MALLMTVPTVTKASSTPEFVKTLFGHGCSRCTWFPDRKSEKWRCCQSPVLIRIVKTFYHCILSRIFFRTGHHQHAIVFSNYLRNHLFICCMSVGLCQSAARGKGKGGKKKLMKVTKIVFVGVRNCVFFLFFFCLFFWFLGFSCLC